MEAGDDLTRDLLRQMAADGADLSQPAWFEFYVVGDDEASASRVADAVGLHGYDARVEYHEEEDHWDCVASQFVVGQFEVIAACETEIIRLATKLGCRYEGFGTEVTPTDAALGREP